MRYPMSEFCRSSDINMKNNYDTYQEGLHDRLTILIGKEKPFAWAKRIGIPSATFSRLWNDGVVPKADTLLCIAKAENVSIDWLLTGKGLMQLNEPKQAIQPPATPHRQPSQPSHGQQFWDEDAKEVQIQPLLNMTAEVLTSDTVYRPALAANIKAFHRSISLEKDHLKMKQRMDSMELKLAALEKRLSEGNGSGKTAVGE